MYQQVQLDYWIIIKIMENTLPLSLLLGGISKERSNHDSYGDNLESFFWLIYWCLISSKQWLITWCVTTVSRRVSLVVLTPPEHLNSPRFQWGSCCSILWFRSSLFFLLFFGHCVVCSFFDLRLLVTTLVASNFFCQLY